MSKANMEFRVKSTQMKYGYTRFVGNTGFYCCDKNSATVFKSIDAAQRKIDLFPTELKPYVTIESSTTQK